LFYFPSRSHIFLLCFVYCIRIPKGVRLENHGYSLQKKNEKEIQPGPREEKTACFKKSIEIMYGKMDRKCYAAKFTSGSMQSISFGTVLTSSFLLY
jgi:hypothetical protein